MEEFEKRAKERAARDKEKAEEDEARALGKSPRSVIVGTNARFVWQPYPTKPIIQAKC